jgi:hypothetical protein
MSPKLKFALIRRCSDRGFAMPVAIGLGLIILLIAATLIMRSQGDRVTASAQKATAQGLAIAEGGLSRSLAKLNQSSPDVSLLLQRNYDPSGLLGTAVNQWTASNMPPCTTTTDLLSGTIGDSSYEVLAYRYDATNKTGTLLVKGLVPYGGASSESRVQQTFNVSPKPGSIIGVLGTNEVNLGNNDVLGIRGNVACTNTTNCPVTCPYTTTSARNAVGADTVNSVVEGKIFVGSVIAPTLPATPATPISLGNINLSGTDTLELPRSTDISTHVAGTPYHYNITSIDVSGQGKIIINTLQDAAKNPTGDPVYFWVSGDMDMGGTTELVHNASSTNLSAFRIYGTSTTDQDLVLSGNGQWKNIFILAPNAKVGINGNGTIEGILYAKSFGEVGSNSNTAAVQVPNDTNYVSSLGDLAAYFSYQTESMNQWQRQAVP